MSAKKDYINYMDRWRLVKDVEEKEMREASFELLFKQTLAIWDIGKALNFTDLIAENPVITCGQTFRINGSFPMPENKSSHLLPALESVSLLLQENALKGMIIGGLAVSLLGRPRYTNDIDLVILDLDDRLPEFLSKLKEYGIEPRINDIEEFARKSRVLLMRHRESEINIDISMGILPLEFLTETIFMKTSKSYYLISAHP
ncbi:MAG: hypothetical protein PVG39_15210 [Desulfobacteraceae bacterium]|jgi:hypothetical protein